MSIIIPLFPYIWSRERPDLQLRVIVALLLLLATKLATLAIPLLFKLVTDALAGFEGPPPAGLPWLVWLVAAPVPIVVAYCVVRVMESTLAQLRDGLFGKVAMHAVRRLAVRTFAHLHELSLRYHLERKIGGLSRVLERGRNGIEIIVRLVAHAIAADLHRTAADRRLHDVAVRLALCRHGPAHRRMCYVILDLSA